MAESVDCSEFCRLCLVKEQVNTHIFEELGELQQIHVKITACLPIKVAYEDSLPKRICDDCIYKLDQQYQFWNTTVNSEKQLKQWLSIVDEPTPKQETEKNKIKKEKEQEPTVTKTRPRRNARRKAAQNVRLAAAAAIAASDSDAGIGGDDMEIDHFAKEENDSDEDYHDNTESLEENTYTNVGLDSEEQAEAGPSGLQKSGAVASANSGSDNGGAGYLQIKLEEVEESLKLEEVDQVITPSYDTLSDTNSNNSQPSKIKKRTKKPQKRKGSKKKSDESYKCDQCSRSFKHKGFLDKHNREVHGSVPTECDFCLKMFNSKKEMKAHRREHLVLFDHHCEKCSLGYGSERELKGHMNSRHGINPHKCPLCPERVFKSPYKLKVHSLTHYKLTNTPYEEHKCHLCEKVFHHQKYLNVHLKLHAGETKVVCDICGKTLNSKQSLDEHLNLHNGIKPYTCKICNKSFVKRNTLRVHKFTHTSEKPHKCDEPGCGKSFTQSSNLVTHKRYHTGERPYKCNFCSAEFVSSFILKDHLQKMHHIVRETNGRDLQSNIYPLFV